MNRTTLIALPVTAFLTWWYYVVTRSGSGPGLKWDRIPNHIYISAVVVGVAYLLFVAIALSVLYFTKVRGTGIGAASVLFPALVRFVIVFAVAVAIASPLGELYVLADERSFAKETAEFMSTAKPVPETGDLPLYSRKRWWPGSGNILVSPDKQ